MDYSDFQRQNNGIFRIQPSKFQLIFTIFPIKIQTSLFSIQLSSTALHLTSNLCMAFI